MSPSTLTELHQRTVELERNLAEHKPTTAKQIAAAKASVEKTQAQQQIGLHYTPGEKAATPAAAGATVNTTGLVSGSYSKLLGRNQTAAEVAEQEKGGANAGAREGAIEAAGYGVSAIASGLFKLVEEAVGADFVKGLLYVVLAGGGAALIIAGIARATGVHPVGAAKKAAAAGALA